MILLRTWLLPLDTFPASGKILFVLIQLHLPLEMPSAPALVVPYESDMLGANVCLAQ